MYNKKQKIIMFSSMVAAVVVISVGILMNVFTSHFTISPKYNEITEGHSIFQKKRFSESLEFADQYNKRQNSLADMSNNPTKSSSAPSTNTVKKIENANNSSESIDLYTLFQSNYFNTDQYIDAKNKINTGIKLIDTFENVSNLEDYYSTNQKILNSTYGISSYKEFCNLVSKFKNFKSDSAGILDNDGISKDSSYNILVKMHVKCSGDDAEQYVKIKYANDISVNVIWVI